MSADTRGEGAGKVPFLSIVLPCYKVAPYLPDALDDLQAQAFGDWELIVVDDGSPDEGAELVRARLASDARIRLVAHGENRGLSAARNTGLAHARGRYVWMPDPDDRYDRSLLETVRDRLAGHPGEPALDIALFGCVEEYVDPKGEVLEERSVLPGLEGVLTAEELHRAVLGLEERTLYGYAWNKVYRRDLLEGARFGNVPLAEDILFNIRVFDRAASCVFINQAPYRYAKRVGSNLTNRFVPDYYRIHRLRIEELYAQQRRWGLDGAEVRSRLGSLFGRYLLSTLERNCDPRSGLDHARRVEWCHALLGDDLFNALIPEAHSRQGKVLEICLAVLKTRCVPLFLATGRVIHLVRSRTRGGYDRLKMQR